MPVAKKSVSLLSINIRVDQRDALKKLSARTRVPQQVYLREAVDMVLAKYTKRAAHDE